MKMEIVVNGGNFTIDPLTGVTYEEIVAMTQEPLEKKPMCLFTGHVPRDRVRNAVVRPGWRIYPYEDEKMVFIVLDVEPN